LPICQLFVEQNLLLEKSITDFGSQKESSSESNGMDKTDFFFFGAFSA